MPDIPVTFGSSLVGRLSCTSEFASVVTDANTQGCRFELSGGYEKRHGENPKLVELVVSPLQPQATLTKDERDAIAVASAYMDKLGNRNTSVQETLMALLARMR